MDKRSSLFFVLMVCTFVFSLDNLYAQRGSGYISTDTTLRTNTLSGFPGMFDVNLPTEGSLVISSPAFTSGNSDVTSSGGVLILPYLNVDYGINESFSIGTNVVSFIPFLAGGAGGSFKARSKIYENSIFSDAVTSYAGAGFFGDDGKLDYSFNYFVLTNGAKFNLNSRSSITILTHFWSIYFAAVQEEIEQNYDETQFTIDLLTSFIGANYHLSFQYLGLSLAVVVPFYVDFSKDTLTERIARNMVGFDSSFVNIRGGIDIKFGDSGLLSLGASYMDFSAQVLNQSIVFWGEYSHRLGF